MTNTWKSKSTDLLLVLVYFMMYSVVVHVLTSIRHAMKYDKDILQSLQSPMNVLLTFGLLFFFMSPVWVYFRKVPKSLKIDTVNRKLEIRKRRKTLRYNLDNIRFYKRRTSFFYVLEIHATFESSRRGQFEKLATSIIAPNRGLSWNRKTMEEIVGALKEMGVEEIENRPHTPISEYFYN